MHSSTYNTKNVIIINKSGYLKYKNLKFRCATGKSGIGKKSKEGDNFTPIGIYKIVKIYYRSDRIKKILSKFKSFQITKNMGWCNDPKSDKYNKLIIRPYEYCHEKLYRKDNIYDLILVLNYNMRPTVKNKGSAIFIHVARKNYRKTAGCIGLKKNNLIKLIKKIDKKVKVIIN
jgi:L,D-peptidoglycan transpeptidase YkuD (ErfK/YbiS/YcfS/YnhG family)